MTPSQSQSRQRHQNDTKDLSPCNESFDQRLSLHINRQMKVSNIELDGRYIRNGLHERGVQSAWGVAAESDLLLLIVDGERQLTSPDPRVISLVQNLSTKLEHCPATVLILNKV